MEGRFIDKRHAEVSRDKLGEHTLEVYSQMRNMLAFIELTTDYGLPTEVFEQEHKRLFNLWDAMTKVCGRLSADIAKMD